MELYKKYRPPSFDKMYGNEETLASLQVEVSKPDPSHAYLLHGPTGTGKTSVGRILASHFKCSGSDFREINTADMRGIDTIREIIKQSQFAPTESKSIVWLIDECHKISNDGMSALLKILEDTPKHVYFILATTDPNKLLPTIRGRCKQYELLPLSENHMHRLLRSVTRSENAKVVKEVYDQIVQDSLGLPRNALQILEQVIGVPEEKQLKIAARAAETQSQVIELCRALLENRSWNSVSKILSGLKDQQQEQIRYAVLGYCNAVILKGENNRAAAIIEQFLDPFYNSGNAGLSYACYVLSVEI